MSYEARRQRRIKKFGEQGGFCLYCDGEMILAPHSVPPPAALATLEHLIQKADGGTYADHNTKVACYACNTFRPDGMAAEAYRRLRQQLLMLWPACTEPFKAIRRMLARYSREFGRQEIAA